jgi:hypothetical protein
VEEEAAVEYLVLEIEDLDVAEVVFCGDCQGEVFALVGKLEVHRAVEIGRDGLVQLSGHLNQLVRGVGDGEQELSLTLFLFRKLPHLRDFQTVEVVCCQEGFVADLSFEDALWILLHEYRNRWVHEPEVDGKEGFVNGLFRP